MGIKNILKMSWGELNKLSRRELAKLTSALASAANKRLDRAKAAGVSSRDIKKARKQGRFSVAGKNTNELRREMARARNFLQSERSSVSDIKKADRQVLERVRTLTGDDTLSKTSMRKIFGVYDKLREEDPYAGYKGVSAQIIRDITTMVQGDKRATQRDLLEKAHERLNSIYEENERINEEFDIGTAQFF